MKRITEITFRDNLDTYINEVANSSEAVVITREAEKNVVVMSYKEYNSISETAHLLSTAANRKRLENSIEQLESMKLIRQEI